MEALFWQFIFYSFCGYLLEMGYAWLTSGHLTDRKCHLLLPVCPVYGIGALLVLALPASVQSSPVLLVLWGSAACTAAEWLLSVFYERAAGAAFWDYRSLPLNLRGRVCLLFSFFWGLLCLPLTYVVAPLVSQWAARIPAAITLPCFLFYVADALLSLLLLRRGGVDAIHLHLPAGERP